MDELGQFLSLLTIVVMLIGIFVSPIVYAAAILILAYEYYRMLSRNIAKRAGENAAYLRFRGRVAGWFSIRKQRFTLRKTYHFYTCASCRQKLRVPKGKGNVVVTCPRCGMRFEKKS